MLATWLYLSTSNLSDREQVAAIDLIVAVSRRRNVDLKVTGALIFSGSRFAQWIEGPPDNVTALRTAIERDTRHANVQTLEAGKVANRQFAGWSLAYSGQSTFVDRELQRVDERLPLDAGGAMRDLKLVLTEFSRTGGIKGF
ncbi:BLUF domain-containing protein [Sphingomonas sp. GM_Shp_1]|uniref:BLUF domain-containing protein n=1 Tax=Sphingomonas sp. GM_Shp_1 TaxID=2937381 RepID=UPI00226BB90D|nr:BLUF domain-containing protein [Sphingomonas sp. GM_Shp_1]